MTKTYSLKEKEEILKISNYKESIFEIIDETKEFILKNDCRIAEIDISSLNLIDATKICILCSAFHFAKYTDGTVTWIVKDDNVKRQIEYLKLDNIEIQIKKPKLHYADFSENFVSFISLCK